MVKSDMKLSLPGSKVLFYGKFWLVITYKVNLHIQSFHARKEVRRYIRFLLYCHISTVYVVEHFQPHHQAQSVTWR